MGTKELPETTIPTYELRFCCIHHFLLYIQATCLPFAFLQTYSYSKTAIVDLAYYI